MTSSSGKMYSDVEEGTYDRVLEKPLTLSECPPNVRAGFVRKVYMLLCMQLMLTGGISALLMFEPTVHTFALKNSETIYIALIFSLFTLCPLIANKDRHPVNLILLLLFTIFQGYIVGFVCTTYMSAGLGTLVACAFLATTTIFGLLSLYVHVTRIDLNYISGTLCAGLFALLFLGLVGVFMPTFIMQAVIAAFGIVIFSGFVLYDTSMMLHYMSVDDAIVASVQLYLDFVNLFLYILQCLSLSSAAGES